PPGGVGSRPMTRRAGATTNLWTNAVGVDFDVPDTGGDPGPPAEGELSKLGSLSVDGTVGA
ncbi:hypothetical protein, partial [Rhodococcus sp. EPR-279]